MLYESDCLINKAHTYFFVFQQTSFVRQNTPHPKELKEKAKKLFNKSKSPNSSLTTEEMVMVRNMTFRSL